MYEVWFSAVALLEDCYWRVGTGGRYEIDRNRRSNPDLVERRIDDVRHDDRAFLKFDIGHYIRWIGAMHDAVTVDRSAS